MISLYTGRVVTDECWEPGVQRVTVAALDGTERPALCYEVLTGRCSVGDDVVVNGTAVDLGLGTGGYDFVVANCSSKKPVKRQGRGRLMKCRYLPCQVAVDVLEEQEEHAGIWELDLAGMPVVAAELHSQIVPIVFGARRVKPCRIAYVMTDTAALPLAFSQTIPRAKADGLIDITLTCGQAFGGDYETVTLHSALLAARHIAGCDIAIVCQGPGNAGTGTKYGFGGIQQAYVLDTIGHLGGKPICAVRMSGADKRGRHQGVSHHTQTCLQLAHQHCIAPIPANTVPLGGSGTIGNGTLTKVENAAEAVDAMVAAGWDIKTMGRSAGEDPVFFQAAAAAGIFAAA